MNKNIIKLFAIVMMIFMIGSVLVACGSKGEQGEQGIQGEPGVQGEKGEQGVAGLTPYIGENGNWWIGDEDTGEKAAGKDADSIRCEEHEWDTEVIVVKEHTIDSVGVILKVCVDCLGAKMVRVNHEYNIVSEVVAPTCTEGGYTYYECACGLEEMDENGEKVKRDLVEALGHNAGAKEYVKNEAGICDCEWNNAWFINCTRCDIELDKGEDGAKKHSFTKYDPVKPEAGVNPCTWCEDTVRAYCDNCDCHEDIIPGSEPRGHKEQEYTNYVVNGDSVVLSYVCDDCGETVEKTVSIATDCVVDEKAATCTEGGYKKVTYTYTVGDAEKTIVLVDEKSGVIAHTEETVAGYLPTCDTKGLSDGKKCSVCGTVTVAQVVIAEIGHNDGEGKDAVTGREDIVLEIGGTKYDAYWCEVCLHWIAYQEHND